MKKAVIASLMGLSILTLSGCGIFQTLEGSKGESVNSYSNVYDLKSEKAYVWSNEGESDIKADLSEDRVGEDVFFIAPTGDINFSGEEKEETYEYQRSIWFLTDTDKEIPTLTSKDALIYISDTKVPEEIVFERFADYGYSIGISGLKEDESGHYYITFAETDEDDYKHYIYLESDASDLTEFNTITRLYLDKVGGTLVRNENVSDGGTVLNLEKGKAYICEFYTGTFYQDFKLKANVRCFGSLERFICYDYEFLHANCIRIEIPDWFKSGYYFVEGVGLFRYVTDEDLRVYNGLTYDESIEWNDPIKQYDEYGVCIYNPSLEIGYSDDNSTLDSEDESEITIGNIKEETKEETDEFNNDNRLDSDSH